MVGDSSKIPYIIAMIDTRLTNSSYFITALSLCDVFLKDQRQYPWIILVPRVENIAEIHQLNSDQQIQLIHDITKVSKAMASHFHPDKINVAALGNIVSQLHVHIVARFKNDPLWPQGIWQQELAVAPYLKNEANDIVLALHTSVCA